MRRGFLGAAVLALAVTAHSPSQAAPPGFPQAQAAFENLTLDQRILAQVLLISAGYSNWVPMPRLSTHHFKALQSFQRDNGFVPDGLLNSAEFGRLIERGGTQLARYGFRYVTYPDRPLSIWAPLGLAHNIADNLRSQEARPVSPTTWQAGWANLEHAKKRKLATL